MSLAAREERLGCFCRRGCSERRKMRTKAAGSFKFNTVADLMTPILIHTSLRSVEPTAIAWNRLEQDQRTG